MREIVQWPEQAVHLKFFEANRGRIADGFIHEKSVPFVIIAQATSGCYEVSSSFGTVRVAGREAFLAPADTPLRIVHHADEDESHMTFRYVHFQFFLSETIDVFSLFTLPPKTDVLTGARLGEWIEELITLSAEKPSIPIIAKRHLLMYQIFIALLDISVPVTDVSLRSTLLHELLPIVTYIRNHISEVLSIDGLIHRFPYSRSAFFKMFKEQFAQTPMEYIKTVRLHTAYRLISGSSKSLSQISEECGFTNLQHFSREFKLMFNSTPSEARKLSKMWMV
jgi:AraC-like DNA-binding protein